MVIVWIINVLLCILSDKHSVFGFYLIDLSLEPLMYCRAIVHASMKKLNRPVELWMGRTGLAKSSCQCVIGRIICSHAIAVLVQLEVMALVQKGLAEAIIGCILPKIDIGSKGEKEQRVSCVTVLKKLKRKCDIETFLSCTDQTRQWDRPLP